MSGARSLALAIGSSLENVSLVGNAVRGILEREPGPTQDASLVEVAVCEAVNNSIIHGYGREPGHLVEVGLRFEAGALTVTVADAGKGFERFPEGTPPMPDGRDLDEMPLGGWGLRIMGAVMEKVGFERKGGKNVLTMVRPWA